jgi:hypothetical protein
MLCWPCALGARVEAVLPASAAAGEPSRRLREAILSAEPLTTMRWLARPRTAAVVQSLANGGAVTHARLDELGSDKGIEYLRAILVSVGLLPDSERGIERIRAVANELAGGLSQEDAKAFRSWATWQVLRHLRELDVAGADLRHPTANARNRLQLVARLIGALNANATTLSTCRQADLDAWFAASPSRIVPCRAFLVWAQRTGHLRAGVEFPPNRRRSFGRAEDAEERCRIARRLAEDDSIDTVDRVAGALVVLFAQPVTRVSALRVDQVIRHDGRTFLGVGPDPLELPQPFDRLVGELPFRRRNGIAEQLESAWLFPGGRAGDHLSARRLTARLLALGIHVRVMRAAALDQLTREVPPAMLAGLIGFSAKGVSACTASAGGTWARYAPLVAR